ncbi:MAG TPA: hypothetical protein VM939_04760 [Gemmatimonadaceae bacterium]|nr:hypothetical protein [Gemmatimonadaceae bacterium]
MRATLKDILAKYGAIAVVIYLTIFTAVLAASYFAIRLGWTPTNIAGSAGVFTAAYLFTKLTQPIRIAATVMLTPIVGRLWRKEPRRPA